MTRTPRCPTGSPSGPTWTPLPVSLAGKQAAWREELTTRFGTAAVAQLMKAVPSDPPVPVAPGFPGPADLEILAERTVASVAARRSTWTVWNVRAEAERQLRAEIPFLPPERHRETADAVTAMAVSPAFSLSVEAPVMLDEPPELRRGNGESVFTEHAAGRYTSQAVLDAETRLVNATRTPAVSGLPGPSAAAALDGFEAVARTSLDAGQRGLVTAFASGSRLLLAGIGPAGSGKTTAMRALGYVLRAGGQRLVPLATSAASADILGRELGLRAENLHKFLHEWRRGAFAGRLRAGGAVPERARMFRLGRATWCSWTRPGWRGRSCSTSWCSWHPRAARSCGSSVMTGSCPRSRAEAMAQAAYSGWKNDMLAGQVTLMAAADGAAVTELSAQARADRVSAGQVEEDGVRLRDGNLAGAGDWIVTRRNDRRLGLFGGRDWVKNGDAWYVERRYGDGSLAVRHLAHGGRVTLPAGYVAAQVQLLYATTAHRAQGTTVDTAHPLITAGMTREALYRPPWMSLLGEQPTAPGRARQWRSHVEVIAAYRDQHTITADDPCQILGSYAEPGHAGHNAYWHAADSVLAARRLSGLDPID